MNEDGLIDYQEFGQINDRYPLVLFPAFRLQDVMQRNSLGMRATPTLFILTLLGQFLTVLLTFSLTCSGEQAWLGVIENYQRSKQIEEYKAQHGGRLPPESPVKMLGKLFCPCFFRQRVHIKVGLDMENRHRDA